MLSLITKSKIRQRIVLLFINNRKAEYYLSEVANIVTTSPGTAQRELNRLIACDLLKFKKRGNLNIYLLNIKYPLLAEISKIITATIGVEPELRNSFSGLTGVKFAFIFGSYAKGGFKSGSDIDLYIIGDISEEKVFKLVQRIEKGVNREINYHVATAKDFFSKARKEFFYKDILKKYILIVGDEDEFRKRIKQSS